MMICSKKFFYATLNQGIYFAPSKYEAGFISTTHGQSIIDQTKIKIEKAIKRIIKMKNDISAIGNALVDTVFKVEHSLIQELGLEIDQMTLSSAEEHSPIIERLIASGADAVSDCGGSATNSLVAAASFGAKCFHICKVSDDQDGIRYLESLKEAGVGHKGNMASAKTIPTGKCLILVTPDAKRTMATALNVSSLMDENDLDLDQIANSKIFYIEGYMVTSEENYKVTFKGS